ncbi:hypothetical protein VTJ04DRAFT_2709 [Mycothermus thermophilus]|uniref:uncharacterized protein n=1 Tax=Humicola insolens TaxID=85995 RepID=UPI0037438706
MMTTIFCIVPPDVTISINQTNAEYPSPNDPTTPKKLHRSWSGSAPSVAVPTIALPLSCSKPRPSRWLDNLPHVNHSETSRSPPPSLLSHLYRHGYLSASIHHTCSSTTA